MKTLLPIIITSGILGLLGCQVLGQAGVNDNLDLSPGPVADSYTATWWGESGNTFFLQFSEDLVDWDYFDLIETGAGANMSETFSSTARRTFVRLRSSDQETADPLTADFDLDGVSNNDELGADTDPLGWLDLDANGVPDDWEAFYGDLPAGDPSRIDGPSLTGHWRLDESAGSKEALDSSEHSRIALVEDGGAVFDDDGGVFRGALGFSGAADDRVALPYSAWDGATDASFSVWLKTDSSSAMAVLSGADSTVADEVKVLVEGTRTRVWAGVSSSAVLDVQGHTGLADLKWHHLVVVRDGASPAAGTEHVALYIDGSLAGQATGLSLGPLSIDREKFTLGQDVDASGGHSSSYRFDGDLDDVRLYDRALTTAEVSMLYNIDADGDGLADRWEVTHFGDVTSQDGTGDPDFDGLSNAYEYAGEPAFVPTRDDLHLDTPDDSGTPEDESHTVADLLRHYGFDSFNISTGADTTSPAFNVLPGGSYRTDVAGERASGNLEEWDPESGGLFGSAFLIDEETDLAMEFGTASDLGGEEDLSFSLWFHFESGAVVDAPLIGITTGDAPNLFNLVLAHAGETSLEYTDTGGDAQSVSWPHEVLRDGVWHHFALVLSAPATGSASASVYVDGEKVGDADIDIDALATSGADAPSGLLIGQRRDATSGDASESASSSERRFDEFRVYTRAMPAEEVRALAGYDYNQDGLPDRWQQEVVDAYGSINDIDDVGPGDTHPGYSKPNSEAYALSLEPDGSDAVTLASIRSAWVERLATLEKRENLVASPPAWPNPDTYLPDPEDVGHTLADSLTLLNHISFAIDAHKGEFLNVEPGTFAVGNATAKLEPFDDDSLPPVGRVTLHNFSEKIPQIVAALNKLTVLSWPSLASGEIFETTFTYTFDEEFISPSEATPEDYTDTSAEFRQLASTTFDPIRSSDNGRVTAVNIDSLSVDPGTGQKARVSILERELWTPYSVGEEEDTPLDTVIGFRVVGSGWATGSGAIPISSPSARATKLDSYGFDVLPFNVVNGEAENVKYDGAIADFSSSVSGLNATKLRQLFEGLGSGATQSELDALSAEFYIEVVCVADFEFPTRLPDVRSTLLPSLAASATGDFAVGTGRAKLALNLGRGLTGADQLATLAIVTDRVASDFGHDPDAEVGFDAESRSDPHDISGQNGYCYPSSLQFAGAKEDYDLVYETGLAGAPDLRVYPGFAAGDTDQADVWKQVGHALAHRRHARLAQVKGGEVFADISYPDEDSITIELYWASQVGNRSPGGTYTPTGDPFRTVALVADGDDLEVTADERTYDLTATATSGGPTTPPTQTWTLDTTAGGIALNEVAAYTGLPGGEADAPAPKLTHTLKRDTVTTSHSITTYAEGQSPFDWSAPAVETKLPGGAGDRKITHTYSATTTIPFQHPDESGAYSESAYGSFFRPKQNTYTGNKWELDGAIDVFASGIDFGSDWGQLKKTTRKIGIATPPQDLITTYSTDGVVTTLGVTDVAAKTDLAYDPGLTWVKTQPGGIDTEETKTTFETVGAYPWAVYKVEPPTGIDRTTMRGHDAKTGLTTAKSEAASVETTTVLDHLGYLVKSSTKDSGLEVASRERTGNPHPSGAPVFFKHLGVEIPEAIHRYPDGKPYLHQPAGGGYQITLYNALGETETSVDSATGIATAATFAPELSAPGYKVTSVRQDNPIDVRHEIYNVQGELVSGTYGSPGRPVLLAVEDSAGPHREYTWTWGDDAEVIEDYGRGGFLAKRHGANIKNPVTYTLAARAGGAGIKVSHAVGGDIRGETYIDLAGRTDSLRAPSAETPANLVDWDFTYPAPEGGEREVEMEDPDDVVYRTSSRWDATNSQWHSFSGVKDMPGYTGVRGKGGLGFETTRKFGARTLSETSYAPVGGAAQVDVSGLATQRYKTQTDIEGGTGQIVIDGSGGRSAKIRFEGGVYKSSEVKLPPETAGEDGAQTFSHEVAARWDDLSPKKISGEIGGKPFSIEFRESDGAPVAATDGAVSYEIDAVEGDQALYTVTVTNTSTNEAVVLEQTDVDGDYSVSGDVSIPFAVEHHTDTANSKFTSILTTQPGTADAASTIVTANAAGAGISKAYPGDGVTPTVTATSTAGGRGNTSTNKRGHTLTQLHSSPATGMLAAGQDWDENSLTAVEHPGDVAVGYAGGATPTSSLVASVTDPSGTRTYGRDAQNRPIKATYSNSTDLGGLVVDAPLDEFGNPDYLKVEWGAANTVFNLPWTPDTVIAKLDAGDFEIPTGRPGGASLSGGPAWDYSYTQLGLGHPGRGGPGTTTVENSAETDILVVGREFFAGGAAAGSASKLKYHRSDFPEVSGDPTLFHTYAHGGDGRRSTLTISAVASPLSLTQYAHDNKWTFGYETSAGGVETGRLESAVLEDDADPATTLESYSYTYDGAGVRLSKTVGTTTTHYAADPNGLNRIAGIDANDDGDATDPGDRAFTYDLDGNRTYDGNFKYVWDALDRLRQVEAYHAGSSTWRLRAEYSYDSEGRRFKKVLYDIATQNKEKTFLFVYDGWNLVYERTLDSSDTLERERKFHWGLDLSATMQGAGGVGGLVAIEDSVNAAGEEFSLPVYDGHGNVIALVDGDGGDVVAQYAYSPFGVQVAQAGAAGRQDDCPFRFSTKYLDEETGLLYYGYRFYSPETGDWLSRDPLGESGGLNLYGFVGNNPVNSWDYLGLATLFQPVGFLPARQYVYGQWLGERKRIGTEAVLLEFSALMETSSTGGGRSPEPAPMPLGGAFASGGSVWSEASLVSPLSARHMALNALEDQLASEADRQLVHQGLADDALAEGRSKHAHMGRGFLGFLDIGATFVADVFGASTISTFADGQTTSLHFFSGGGIQTQAATGTDYLFAGLYFTPLGFVDDTGRAVGGARSGFRSLGAPRSGMIATPGGQNLRAVAAGAENLTASQSRVLAQLDGFGSQAIIPKKGFGLNDLAALSARTGDEFAMFTTGGRRLIMRGDALNVPVTTAMGRQLSSQGWRWSAHVHPDGVLRSSIGDRGVLGVFGNGRSAILDPYGGRSLFSPAGDMVSPTWLPK